MEYGSLLLVIISLNLYRIIQAQKKQIGVMRAAGMNSNEVMQFYTWYGLFIGVVGAYWRNNCRVLNLDVHNIPILNSY